MNYKKVVDTVYKQYGVKVSVDTDDRSVIISGECDNWQNIVIIGKMFVDKKSGKHVVNNIRLIGATEKYPILPTVKDKKLDGTDWDGWESDRKSVV